MPKAVQFFLPKTLMAATIKKINGYGTENDARMQLLLGISISHSKQIKGATFLLKLVAGRTGLDADIIFQDHAYNSLCRISSSLCI